MEYLGVKYPDPIRVFRKYEKPVLIPDPSCYWRSKAVFNPAVFVTDNGVFKMIYRAVGEYYRYISRFGLAISSDGVNFEYVSREPLMIPIDDDEWWGVEDPRITLIDDRIILTYVKWNKRFTKIGFAEVIDKDGKTIVKRLGVVNEPINTKNAAVIKVGDKLVLIHRPWSWGVKPSIWCSIIDSLEGHVRIDTRNSWILYETPRNAIKSGLGPQPVRISSGEWLLIYHVVYPPEVYTVYAALVDKDFKEIISKTPAPVLVPEPRYEWEVFGDVPFTVFPSGLVVVDDTVYLYYGAGDKVVMLARADLSELLMILDKYRG